MTPAEIIYQRRIAVLEHAQRNGNVAETCRVFGISRTRYYQWKNLADRYGLDALMPKARRAPQMPEATPTHVVARALLTLAVVEPTIGCRQYADRLARPGLRHRQVDRPEAPGGPRPGAALPAPGPGGGHHRGHDGSRHRGGPR